MTADSLELVDADALRDLDLDADHAYAVLADSRRRGLLERLRGRSAPTALADLARELATDERDEPFEDVPVEAVTRIYASLYHHHVPKLAEAGLVEYDPDDRTVALADAADAFTAAADVPTRA